MTKPWYKKGLKFGCTGCGQCCTGAPGFVWVNQKEIEAMAEYLKMPVPEFVKMYTRQIGNRISLKEFPRTYDCIFLRDKLCSVYGARPTQCRTFPFWDECVESEAAWDSTARRCEGINHADAPLIPLGEIEKRLDENDS